MSIRPGDETPPASDDERHAVMFTLEPKPRVLGDNFTVRRALPASE
jgi:hypothetical protein